MKCLSISLNKSIMLCDFEDNDIWIKDCDGFYLFRIVKSGVFFSTGLPKRNYDGNSMIIDGVDAT